MATAEEAVDKFRKLRAKYTQYPSLVYEFVCEALDYTLKKVVKAQRHVKAHEILEGFRLCAIEQFGCLAKTVLDEWNLRTTSRLSEVLRHY